MKDETYEDAAGSATPVGAGTPANPPVGISGPEIKHIKRIAKGIIGAGAIILLLVVIFGTFVIIGPGERGVLVTMGKVEDRIFTEGLNFKIPIIQSVAVMDVKTLKHITAGTSSASKDLQIVTTDVTLNYHIDPLKVNKLYQEVGRSYETVIIEPSILESTKASTAHYTAEELITKREFAREEIKTLLISKLNTPRGIIVDEISITNFAFSPEFEKAIEAKVTAEQNALAAKNKLEQIKFEAEQRIAQAKGESEAIQIQAQAINAQGGKDYVQLQAINKWTGVLPVVMMSNGATPFIDISGIVKTGS